MMVHGTQLSSETIDLIIGQSKHLLLLPNFVCISRGLICEGWFEMLLCAYKNVINTTISMRNINWLQWNGWQCKAHSECQNDW